MRYLKSYKIFEDVEPPKSKMCEDIEDMLLELQDEGMEIKFNNVRYLKGRMKFGTYEFVISKPNARDRHRDAPMFDVSNLVLWGEVKEVVRRIANYVYSNGGSIRFFSDGIEWGVNNNSNHDFINNYDSDGISQFNLRLLIEEKEQIQQRQNESFEYKGVKYKYEWCMANSPIRQELERNISDIQLEAKDMGYAVSHGWVQDPYVWIGCKALRKKSFDLEELSDTIERLKDYLTSQGFEIDILNLPNQIYIYFNHPGIMDKTRS